MYRVKRYWTYMLRCRDGSYYVGVTSNLEQRIAQHRHGAMPTCYTFPRRPLALVWSQSCKDVDDAIRCEKKLQGWTRAKKQALLAGDWDTIRELSRAHASTSSA